MKICPYEKEHFHVCIFPERESLALCVGTTAASHIDLVLTHIDMWLKSADPAKKPLSFFNLIKVCALLRNLFLDLYLTMYCTVELVFCGRSVDKCI